MAALPAPSLDRVRSGLERVSAELGDRISDPLASYAGGPGKMLRGRYALLLAGALGTPEDIAEGAARTAELIHNASLLHDDCIDEAALRRGAPTPNALFEDRTGILLGDLAFSAGLEEASKVSPRATRLLAEAVRDMAVGQVQELFLRGSLKLSLNGYFGIAARKTGALFEWVGRVLSLHTLLPHRSADPARLGLLAGVLLQAVDDIHDFTLTGAVAGKTPGRDWMTGRLTLPGILAMDDERARPGFEALWAARSQDGSFERALALLEGGGHLQKARAVARELLGRMLPLARRLPRADGAAALSSFLEAMAHRQF